MNNRFDPDAEITEAEDERAQELLAELGLCVVLSQAIEHALVTLLALAAQRDSEEVSGVRLRELMDTRYSQTMGVLVRDSLQAVGVPAETEELLTRSLRVRNFLAHQFFRNFAPAAFDVPMGIEAVRLLRRARALFEATQDALQSEMNILLEQSGVSPDEAAQHGFDAVERYIDAGVNADAIWQDLRSAKGRRDTGG